MGYIDVLRNNIPTGKENAIHLDDLAQKLNDTSSRTKKQIQSARREGEWICSNQRGYWYTESEEEIKAYYYMLRKQALSRLETINPVRRTLNEVKGQISLTGDFVGMPDNGGDDHGKEKV